MSSEIDRIVPNAAQYERMLGSGLMGEMTAFSKDFRSRHAVLLEPYAHKWVPDPLHQWSRQYEYPYVAADILSYADRRGGVQAVLDAGSGLTFLPFFLESKLKNAQIHCCDQDQSLESGFAEIGSATGSRVGFTKASLQDMGFQEGQFDAVYCVSVLEHTDDYEKVVGEFYRVLAPGGKLWVTFDISLDGDVDIPVDKALCLLRVIEECFGSGNSFEKRLPGDLEAGDIVTTTMAQKWDETLLPWKPPTIKQRLKQALSGGRARPWPPRLTFCCVSFLKRG